MWVNVSMIMPEYCIWALTRENLALLHAIKDADQPAHPCSLISALLFAIWKLVSLALSMHNLNILVIPPPLAFNIGFYAYAIIGHTQADQLLPQLLMEQFDTIPIQCRHIEYIHEGVWFRKIFFDKMTAVRT